MFSLQPQHPQAIAPEDPAGHDPPQLIHFSPPLFNTHQGASREYFHSSAISVIPLIHSRKTGLRQRIRTQLKPWIFVGTLPMGGSFRLAISLSHIGLKIH